MAVQDYSDTAIITIGPPNQGYDQDVYNSLIGLYNKTKGNCIDWHTGPEGALKDVEGIRLYLHGHGDFTKRTLGNLNASSVAARLVNYFRLTEKTTNVISITGCNSARGDACIDTYRKARNVLAQNSVHPDYPHLTNKWLAQDSRLVDTTKTAASLCNGSFAQKLHEALLNRNIKTTVYARLYVVAVEDDGEKRTMHYYYNKHWDKDGKNPHASYDHNEKNRTKIKISATGGGQNIEYVHYDNEANAKQNLDIQIVSPSRIH